MPSSLKSTVARRIEGFLDQRLDVFLEHGRGHGAAFVEVVLVRHIELVCPERIEVRRAVGPDVVLAITGGRRTMSRHCRAADPPEDGP